MARDFQVIRNGVKKISKKQLWGGYNGEKHRPYNTYFPFK